MSLVAHGQRNDPCDHLNNAAPGADWNWPNRAQSLQ